MSEQSKALEAEFDAAVAEGTGLPPPPADAPHVTGSKRKPAPLARRLAAAKSRSAALAQIKKTKLTVHIRVPIDVYEALLEIGEKNGPEPVASVARRCMMDGLRRLGKTHRMNMRITPFEEDSYGVFDRHEELANAQRGYGQNEPRARDNLRSAAEENRDQLATDLHIPGRKRAV